MSVSTAVLSDEQGFCDRVIAASNGTLHAIPLVGDSRVRLALRASSAQVAVIDYAMDDALSLCGDLASDHLRVIVADVPRDDDAAIETLAAGASGVVYADAPLTDVVRAVHAVQSGLIWAPRHVVAATWRKLQREAAAYRASETTLITRLSKREREVLQLTAAGLGNREIARRLRISEATVKVHLTHIFQKLGLRSRARLAAVYFGHNPIVVRPPSN